MWKIWVLLQSKFLTIPNKYAEILLPVKSILLLHGALGAQAQFANLKELLQAQYNIHTLDFEGHGTRAVANDRPFRIDHFAENVREYCAAHSLVKPCVFGYSMGGYVALRIAETTPDLIGDIFTLATKFAWNPETSAKETGFLDAAKIEAKVPKYAEFLRSLHGEYWQDMLAQTKDMMLDLGNAPVLSPEALRSIPHRTRIALGDHDAMVTLRETEEYYRALPNSEMQVFPHTQHPLEKVPMGLLAEAIKEFFG